jgi:hypothetical protein
VSNDDNGSTVHLTVGQQLHVALSGGWTAPAEGDNAVLHRLGSYSSPDFSSAKADFEAVRPGATDVTSSSDAACFDATPPCRMPTQLWTVHVIVD